MIIFPLVRQLEGRDLFLQYPVMYAGKQDQLWYQVERQYEDFVTDLLDGPLVALLPPAMAKGEDIYIKGAISERLYYHLSRSYQVLIRHVIPNLKIINIYPDTLVNQQIRGPYVAAGFSCGVDSFCTLDDHFYANPPAGFKLTHLVFGNVGSHDEGGERLFDERYQKNKKMVDRIGLPYIKINSNLDQFYTEITFLQAATPRNASLALILQKGIGRFYISSADEYQVIQVETTVDLQSIDQLGLPLLSTESLDFISTVGEFTRLERILKVAEINDSYDSLDVCISPKRAGNCSRCVKCMRTIQALEIAGLSERYASAFDIKVYQEGRTKHLGDLIFRDTAHSREVFELARARNFKIPPKAYILGFFDLAKNPYALMLKMRKLLIRKIKQIISPG